ncbi:hypothetical protein Deiofobo_0263 [Pseudomonas phage Deifobo]|nr:hypothetical protein Deiofobo_0263 [Pseudomonas phage Deifobo]
MDLILFLQHSTVEMDYSEWYIRLNNKNEKHIAMITDNGLRLYYRNINGLLGILHLQYCNYDFLFRYMGSYISFTFVNNNRFVHETYADLK